MPKTIPNSEPAAPSGARVLYNTYHYEDGPRNRYGNIPKTLVNQTRERRFPSAVEASLFLDRLKDNFCDTDGARVLFAHAERLVSTLLGQSWKRFRTIENLSL